MKVLPCGPSNPKIYILGMSPGQDEIAQGKPFVGRTSYELDKLLRELGIIKEQCRLGNVFQSIPPAARNSTSEPIDNFVRKTPQNGFVPFNNAYVAEHVAEEVRSALRDIEQTHPNIVICLGTTALWAMAGTFNLAGRAGHRGFISATSSGQKFLATFHPAAIAREPSLRWLVKHDLSRAKKESEHPSLYDWESTLSLQTRPSYSDARDYFSRLHSNITNRPTNISVDIETRANHIACIGFAENKTSAFCLPLMCVEDQRGYFSFEEELALIEQIQSILTHPNARIIGQNYVFDMQYMEKYWRFKQRIWRDTCILQHTLFPNMRKALDLLATLYCEHPRHWKEDGKNWDPSIPEDQLWRYNAMDVCITFEIYEALDNFIERAKKTEQRDFLMELYNETFNIMRRGVLISTETVEDLRDDLKLVWEEKQSFIDYVCGHPLNIRSPLQLKNFFYNDLKQEVIKDRKTHSPTTSDYALEKIGKREPLLKPVTDNIRIMRSIGVFRGNFLSAEWHEDGRMRTFLNAYGTETYRFSSKSDVWDKGTNLQNIPSGDSEIADFLRNKKPMHISELLKKFPQDAIDIAIRDGAAILLPEERIKYGFALPNVRRIFIPDPGYTILDMDLDRADLQVVAWVSGEKRIKDLLKSGLDFHSENAKVIGTSRQVAKIFCHGTNYGATPRTLAIQCGITIAEAERGQKLWFGANPGIKNWHRQTQAKLLTTGTISNAFGFSIKFLGRPEDHFTDALAWEPQSTVAIVINKALLNIAKNSPKTELLLQVHDSLVFQHPTKDLNDSVIRSIEELARIPIPYPDDPLIIPVSFKHSTSSWGDCKKWQFGSCLTGSGAI